MMVQNVGRGFNSHGVKKVFFYNLVIMYWTLNIIYVQFSTNVPSRAMFIKSICSY